MDNSNGKQDANILFSDRSRYGAINNNKSGHKNERQNHDIVIAAHLFSEESGAKTKFLGSPREYLLSLLINTHWHIESHFRSDSIIVLF